MPSIADYIKPSRIFMYILMWLIIELTFWAMNSPRDGIEIAAIMGGSLVPMIGMMKFILEWSDRKKP